MENKQDLKIWFNTAEPSGDLQAASLLQALKKLRPITAYGMGGSALAAAGQTNILSSNELAVMGFSEIISVIPKVWRILRQIKAQLINLRPDLVILVDAPEFNFRVAKIAKSLGIPVYYFIPPKIWAWRTGRIKFMRRYIAKIFCILPFEVDFYAKHGVKAYYVGNPLLDSLTNLTENFKPNSSLQLNGSSLTNSDLSDSSSNLSDSSSDLSDSNLNDSNLTKIPSEATVSPPAPHNQPTYIGLLPGSRRKEVMALLPIFCQSALILQQENPHAKFYCFRADNLNQAWLQSFIPAELEIQFIDSSAKYSAMRQCSAVLAASGTVILELGLLGVPTVVTYKVSKLTAWIGTKLIKLKYFSLPNLILQNPLFPEFLQEQVNAPHLAQQVLQLIHTKPQIWQDQFAKLRELCHSPSHLGAADFAAQKILEDL